MIVSGCGSVSVSVARCRESFGSREEYNAATDNGTSCSVGCSSSTETIGDGTHSFSVGEPDCGRWQLDVNYAGRSLCNGSGCNWDEDVCEGRESGCGDGILDAGEQCEVGNPTGVSCSWAACNQGMCTCPAPVIPEKLQVSGSVYCQDPNGQQYPVEGATIYLYKDSAQLENEILTTGADGTYASAADTTLLTDGGFAVRYQGLRDLTQLLPTGVTYGEMEGPVMANPSICTTGICEICSSGTINYEGCSGMQAGLNEGYSWVFSNCSLEQVNPDWSIEKQATPVCYEEGTESAYADVTYVITVENVTGGGTVEYVEDTYDTDIDSSWIQSTTPEATVDEDTITWTLTGDDGVFAEGQTKTFQYVVRIPKEQFGQELTNHVIAHLSTDEDLHAYEDIFATCAGPVAPLPETGLFDSTVVRIGLGLMLLGMGIMYYRFGLLDGMLSGLGSGVGTLVSRARYAISREGKKSRWERDFMRRVGKQPRK